MCTDIIGSHWLFAPEKNGKSCQAQSKVKHKVIICYVQLACHTASQPYFSLTPNQYQPPANSNQQYFSLITNQHQLSATASQTKLGGEDSEKEKKPTVSGGQRMARRVPTLTETF